MEELPITNDLDYLVGHLMTALLPDFVAAGVIAGIDSLALDPYFNWAEKPLAKLPGALAWMFLVVVVMSWLCLFFLAFYFACHGLLVFFSFVPTLIAEADRIKSGVPFFPLHDYSEYTLYFLKRESQITLGPTWDCLLKGLTPAGTALLFGGEEMRFSVAEARVRELWGVLGNDRFTGAVIRTVLLLVNFAATIGSAWGFLAFAQKTKRRWSRSSKGR